jgi:hypothetical protein
MIKRKQNELLIKLMQEKNNTQMNEQILFQVVIN